MHKCTESFRRICSSGNRGSLYGLSRVHRSRALDFTITHDGHARNDCLEIGGSAHGFSGMSATRVLKWDVVHSHAERAILAVLEGSELNSTAVALRCRREAAGQANDIVRSVVREKCSVFSIGDSEGARGLAWD